MERSSAAKTGQPSASTMLIGAVSAIFWALMLVVTLKYVVLILRADNNGEGGLIAMLALASQAAGLLAERWFFFAQARHPQNIYYQAVS